MGRRLVISVWPAASWMRHPTRPKMIEIKLNQLAAEKTRQTPLSKLAAPSFKSYSMESFSLASLLACDRERQTPNLSRLVQLLEQPVIRFTSAGWARVSDCWPARRQARGALRPPSSSNPDEQPRLLAWHVIRSVCLGHKSLGSAQLASKSSSLEVTTEHLLVSQFNQRLVDLGSAIAAGCRPPPAACR